MLIFINFSSSFHFSLNSSCSNLIERLLPNSAMPLVICMKHIDMKPRICIISSYMKDQTGHLARNSKIIAKSSIFFSIFF